MSETDAVMTVLDNLIETTAGHQSWRREAACRGADLDLFFPISDRTQPTDPSHPAKAICRPCPVRTECLAWALDTGQQYGVFGGQTAAERATTIRRRTRPRANTP